MDRKPIVKRKTAISYKTEEKTVLRGYNVSDLAEAGYTFYDALFILYQNRIPAENEADMLRYETGEFLEHSMSPSAASAIAVIGGRPNLPAAIASAVMTFGSAHGPGAAHGYMMHKYIERARVEGKTLEEMGKILVDEYMDAGLAVMGRALQLSDCRFELLGVIHGKRHFSLGNAVQMRLHPLGQGPTQ